MFGPSALGHKKVLNETLFPAKGALVLETISSFGLMFYYFLWSLRLDLYTLLKTEKVAVALAISVFTSSLVVPAGLSLLLKKYVAQENNVAKALPFVGLSQAYTVFVSVTVLLTDLKMLNTDIGRLTISVSILISIAGFILSVIMSIVLQSQNGNILTVILIALSVISFVLFITFTMRPVVLWMVKHPGRGSINEICIVCIFVFVMLSGFLGDIIGQHFPMGPIIFGLSLPEGPPIGTSLMTILDTMCTAFLNPICLAVHGLKADIFQIDLDSTCTICLVLAAGLFTKIGAVMVSGYYFSISMKECWVIGLILNGRGISELVLYNLWLQSEVCMYVCGSLLNSISKSFNAC